MKYANARKQKNSLKNVCNFLLYFFCALPFLYILPISSDVQPYALLYSLLYLLLLRQIKIPEEYKKTWSIFVLIFFIAILTAMSHEQELYLTIRKAYNYVSVLFIPIAVYNSLLASNGIEEKWIKSLILLWFIVGAIQLTVSRDFMGNIVSNIRTSADRGVNSLASEPSFYGYIMFFFFVLSGNFKTQRLCYQVLCIFQIVFLAQSAVSIVYLLVYFLSYIAENYIFGKVSRQRVGTRIIWLISIGIFFAVVILIVTTKMQDTRLFILGQRIVNRIGTVRTIEDIYKIDVSTGMRVENLVAPITAFLNNGTFPHGFVYGDIFSRTARIQSGYGTMLYEFGFLSVYLIYIFTKSIYEGTKRNVAYTVAVFAMMFSAVQIGNSMYAFVLGYAIYNKKVALQPEKNDSTEFDIKDSGGIKQIPIRSI